MTSRPSRLAAYLTLGRVSNLPTVWTNVCAGMVLSRAPFDTAVLGRLIAAVSLLYVGGMFLNDAFDRDVDRVERPERPIPSGAVGAAEVFLVSALLLTLGFALVLVNRAILGQTSPAAPLAAAALTGLIVLYDAWHKQNPLSPFVMGLCRGAVYLVAAYAAGGFAGPTLLLSAAALSGYVVGLTFVARQENRRSFRAGATLGLLSMPATILLVAPLRLPLLITGAVLATWVVIAVAPLFSTKSVDVKRSVVRLIAGISLVDALFVSSLLPALSAVCLLGFALTLGLQRVVRGT